MVEKKIFLLDAFALIYRAYFAFSKNPRLTSQGLNTSAIFGFVNTIVEIIVKEKPSHLAIAFDTPKATFRHEMYPEYKAQRDSMPEDLQVSIPYCKAIIEAFNIPILEREGYEADDIIGTVSKKISKMGYKVFMMTPDKDFAQLVDANVFLYKPARSGNTAEIFDIGKVLEKFNINQVEQVIDYLGLKGDAVDNIPGIPGIGDKTASNLLKEFDSIENIIDNVDSLKGKLRENIKLYGEQGLLSKKLATIDVNVPIEVDIDSYVLKSFDFDRVKILFEELEFRTLLNRLESLFLNSTDKKLGGDDNLPKTLKDTPHNYDYLETIDQVYSLVEKLKDSKELCVDTETTSLRVKEAKIVGISLLREEGEAYYVNCLDKPTEKLELLKVLLENPSITKIGQNLKYDIQILKNYNIALKGRIFDTMLAHFLVDPESAVGMDILAERYLNYKTIKYEEVAGKGVGQKTLDQIDPKNIIDYACEDVDVTYRLKKILENKIKEVKLDRLLHDVEEPLSFVLAEMEYEGVNIDLSALRSMSKELDREIEMSEKKIYDLSGEDFNVASPKQLGIILFEKLNLLENPKKTKSGQYATSESVLSKLAPRHKIVSEVLAYREYKKLKSTYVDALPLLVSPVDNRIHTDYRQTVASTGRLSSNNPNLQNIPIRTEKGKEIRKAFIPRNEEYLMMSADYSQIELRIMAVFSEDHQMLEAFKKGVDIHATTASKIYNVDLSNVKPSMRRKAKEVNFGIIYGISSFGLSQNLNISKAEAKKIIDAYFSEFRKVKNYMEKMIEKAKETGFVSTYLGRRRYLRNINSKNFAVRGFDERNAINMPIQGTAADIIKIAMINIHQWMKKQQLKSKMILQIHDELVFDVHKDEQEIMQKNVRRMMENAVDFPTPISVEIGFGNNWFEAH